MARKDRDVIIAGIAIIALAVCTRTEMACHKHLNEELPPCLQKKEIEKLENNE